MRLAVAERVDIIVDFGKIKSSRLYLVNRAEQVNGRGPTGKVLTPRHAYRADQHRIEAKLGRKSVDPRAAASAIGIPLRPLPDPDFAALQAKAAKLPTRTWRFERGNGGWTVNGKFFDEEVVSAEASLRSEKSGSSKTQAAAGAPGARIHFEEHRILSRNGVPVKPATPHPSPHFVSDRILPNRPLLTSISANRCISGSSRCSGMLGISS